ncbi:MAG: hypothetical protein ABEJ03_00030 [Candidatus Nanohaloarchaea archaeon]
MQDPWKYVAFPLAAVAGYLASLTLTSQIAEVTALKEFYARLAVIAGTGLFAGFLVDELIPAYIEEKRGGGGSGGIGGGGGGDDMDFGGDTDLDFDE